MLNFEPKTANTTKMEYVEGAALNQINWKPVGVPLIFLYNCIKQNGNVDLKKKNLIIIFVGWQKEGG